MSLNREEEKSSLSHISVSRGIPLPKRWSGESNDALARIERQSDIFSQKEYPLHFFFFIFKILIIVFEELDKILFLISAFQIFSSFSSLFYYFFSLLSPFIATFYY